jgi:hypothetical protein
MKIEISDESVDALIRDILVRDYGWMADECKDMEKRKQEGNLPPYTEYDLENNKVFLDAFETLLKYYLPISEANAIIKEKRA